MSGTKRTVALPCMTEGGEQQSLFLWALYRRAALPELDLLYHIPNGGSRSKAEAGRFKAEGVKAGVPDICLPVARGGFHGLYIELKREHGGRKSAAQRKWLHDLQEQGYRAVVCRGWREASEALEEYLGGGAS